MSDDVSGAPLRGRALLAPLTEPVPVSALSGDDSSRGAQENLDLALANDPRTATPLEASEALLALTAMFSHRGDGIPIQYVHGRQVAEHANIMWLALLTALRALAVEGGKG